VENIENCLIKSQRGLGNNCL